MISALEFSRYRGFRDHTSVRLERLTLVYGENNAGKSALLRLPQIIAASRVNGQAGLDLRAPVLRRAGFRDIQWRGLLSGEEDGDLVLGITLSDGVRWRWTLRWLESRSIAVIQRLEVFDKDGQTSLELTRAARDSPYLRSEGGAMVVVAFDGLLLASTKRIPRAVGLHWVESGSDGAAVVEEIAIDDASRPESTRLERAFDTMGILRRELIAARRARETAHGG